MNEWIKTSERLPEEAGYYLIVPPYFAHATTGYWDDEIGCWILESQQGYYAKYKVKYWMPLPQIPVGDDE